jgi:NAD(P)-dependent dehydrogenase (short-subunit alcohol dehydrogenase family)
VITCPLEIRQFLRDSTSVVASWRRRLVVDLLLRRPEFNSIPVPVGCVVVKDAIGQMLLWLLPYASLLVLKYLSWRIIIIFVFQNGVIRGLLLAFQYMGQNSNKKGGVVVNIASIPRLDPLDICPIYSGIKHGVVGLTKAFGVWDCTCVSNNAASNRSGVEWESSLNTLQTTSGTARLLASWASNQNEFEVNF